MIPPSGRSQHSGYESAIIDFALSRNRFGTTRGSASISAIACALDFFSRILAMTARLTSEIPYLAMTTPRVTRKPMPPIIPAGPPNEARATVIAAAPLNPESAIAPSRTRPGTPAAASKSTVLKKALDFLSDSYRANCQTASCSSLPSSTTSAFKRKFSCLSRNTQTTDPIQTTARMRLTAPWFNEFFLR